MDDEQLLELLTNISDLAGMGIEALTGGAAPGPDQGGETAAAEQAEPPA